MLEILKEKKDLENYLKSQRIPEFLKFDISDRELWDSEEYREKFLEHLKKDLVLPDFVLDLAISEPSIVVSLKELYTKYHGDSTLVIEKLNGSIVGIRPEKYLPIGITNSISRVLRALSDNPRMIYQETILEDNISVLYSMEKYQSEGGIVFMFYPESNSVYVRRYLNLDGLIVYLPSRYYNRSSGRYDRFTGDYSLSIDTLVQRILSEVETLEFMSDMLEQKASIEYRKELTLEEVSRIAGSTGDSTVVVKMLEPYEDDVDFEDKFEDYLWRCTNLKASGHTVGDTLGKLKDFSEEVLCSTKFRETVGDIFSGIKIADRLFEY